MFILDSEKANNPAMNKKQIYTPQQNIKLSSKPGCCTDCEFLHIIQQILF